MKSIGVWLFLLLIQLSSLGAKDLYLLYDATCMDRLAYVNSVTGETETTYSFKLGEDRFLTLDMGSQEFRRQEDLSGKLSDCSSFDVDKSLAINLSQGKTRLFVVVAEQEKYLVSPVLGASYFGRSGNSVDCILDGVSVRLFTDNQFVRMDMGDTISGREVYLDGTVRLQCMTGYRLQVREPGEGRSQPRSYLYLPAVGLVERSAALPVAGPHGQAAAAATWRLTWVGPISLDEALMLRCGRQQAAAARQGVPVVTAAADKVPDEPVAGPAGQTDPCAPSDTPGIHTVRKGETIYAISRQYGVSVADIKTWNQLSGTMIGVCSKLFVRDPATVQTGMTRSVPAAETDPLPARVEYWLDAPAVHTVRPGETVAGLARLFGYTEDRFRRMNALRPDGRLVPGQQVRTTDCICPGDPLVQAASLSEGLSGGSDPGTAADPTDVYFKPVGIHRVSPTETLFGIARQYGTTVERLRELNGMDADDDIRPGQRIYIQ